MKLKELKIKMRDITIRQVSAHGLTKVFHNLFGGITTNAGNIAILEKRIIELSKPDKKPAVKPEAKQ